MATCYISYTDGDDARTAEQAQSSATPWKTIAKVNSYQSSLVAGDTVSFKCGDTWTGETLTITKSGSSGSPITYNSYGTGAKPIFTGFQTLSSWTDYGSGIYYASVSGAEAQTNMVTVDGAQVAMGRYPNDGTFLTYESFTTYTITDTGIGDTPNWAGAELVINKNYWTWDRCPISDHTGDVFTFTNLGTAQAPEGTRRYFIQNDLRCLDATNEWYHDYAAGRLYIYGNPATKTVKIATIKNLIYNDNYDYLTIDGIEFIGSINDLFIFGPSSSTTSNIIIQNCNLSFGGEHSIIIKGVSTLTIDNCEISYSNQAAIRINTAITVPTVITNNNVHHIGLLVGQAYAGTYSSGIMLGYGATTNILVQYNVVRYIAYSGVTSSSNTAFQIKNNFITHCLQVVDDGGGVYFPSTSGISRVVDSNIILDSGTGAPSYVIIPRGIYTDAYASGATITNNVVANCREAGIFSHNGSDQTITGNLCYNNGAQMIFKKITTSVSGCVVNNNKFISKGAQYALWSYDYTTGEIQGWGTFDYNYYARPYDDDYVIRYTGVDHTLSDWKTLVSPDDTNSYGYLGDAISSEDDIHFIYNNTLNTKSFVLSATMEDVAGDSYSGTIELDPYTGLVLMGTGTVTETGTIYYIDPNGIDSIDRDGLTTGTAWASLSYACSRATTVGDTIFVNAGIYTEPTYSETSVGVSMLGASKELCKIHFTYNDATFSNACIRLVSTTENTPGNQFIKNLTITGSNLTAQHGIYIRRRGNITIENVIIEDFLQNGLHISGSTTLGSEPTNYATGIVITNCIINNCSAKPHADVTSNGSGMVRISGTDGLEFSYSTLSNIEAAEGLCNNNIDMQHGYNKNFNFHHNKSYKPVHNGSDWNFHIEEWTGRGGNRIYLNEFWGGGYCLDIAGYSNYKGISDYSWLIENNLFADTTQREYGGSARSHSIGVAIEGDTKDVIVRYNHFKNIGNGVTMNSAKYLNPDRWYNVERIKIYYNLFENVSYLDTPFYNTWIIVISSESTEVYHKDIDIWNNTVVVNTTHESDAFIFFEIGGDIENISVKNNIIEGMTIAPFYNYLYSVGSITNFNYDNNLINGCGNNNDFWDRGGTCISCSGVNNVVGFDPLFVSSSDFNLQDSSPARDAGIDVGLTSDFIGTLVPYGSAPDIGAYEYKDSEILVSVKSILVKYGII